MTTGKTKAFSISILLKFVFFTHCVFAQVEDEVDLNKIEAKPHWNPYDVNRNQYFILIPIAIFLITVIHLFSKRKSLKFQKKQIEKYFNE